MKYYVYDKRCPNKGAVIDIPDEYLEERGKGQMAVKGYFCSKRGSFKDYEKLRARRARKSDKNGIIGDWIHV